MGRQHHHPTGLPRTMSVSRDEASYPLVTAERPGLLGRLKRLVFPIRPTRITIVLTLAIFATIGLAVGILYLMVAKPTYTSNMLIGPSQEQFASTPSSQLDRNALSMLSGGGLLSGPRSISPYDAFLQTLQTRAVAEHLYNDPSVRAMLFGDVWDSERKEWKAVFSLRAAALAPLYAIIGRTYPDHPSIDTMQDILKNRLQVQMIERGPMYNLNYAATSRDAGVTFLQKAFQTADQIVKDKERRQVLARIQFLKMRMQSMEVVDYRSQFAGLIMEQEKQLMILQGDTNFAASVIVAPNAPQFPDSPRLFVTLILCIVLFIMLGVSSLALAYRGLLARGIRGSRSSEEI